MEKKTLAVLGNVILILILLMLMPFIISPIINNLLLNNFANNFNECPLPDRTEFIEQESVCGKLSGNGNGMNFFSGIVIKSDLSLEELEEYYMDKKSKSFDKKNNIEIDVISAKGPDGYLEHRDVNFDSLINMNDYTGYYVISVFDGGYSGGWDIRAH